jgi:hypothetical protein
MFSIHQKKNQFGKKKNRQCFELEGGAEAS